MFQKIILISSLIILLSGCLNTSALPTVGAYTSNNTTNAEKSVTRENTTIVQQDSYTIPVLLGLGGASLLLGLGAAVIDDSEDNTEIAIMFAGIGGILFISAGIVFIVEDE